MAEKSETGEAFFSEWAESTDAFDKMGLNESLLRGIYAYGQQPPAAIRHNAILWHCESVYSYDTIPQGRA